MNGAITFLAKAKDQSRASPVIDQDPSADERGRSALIEDVKNVFNAADTVGPNQKGYEDRYNQVGEATNNAILLCGELGDVGALGDRLKMAIVHHSIFENDDWPIVKKDNYRVVGELVRLLLFKLNPVTSQHAGSLR